jgi:microfibrillar-associated protein 1
LVAEAVQKEITQATSSEALNPYDSDENMPDWARDSDQETEDRTYLNNQQAYEDWKIRELRRIKRGRDEQKARDLELQEIERRRKMTDAERLEENLRLGSDSTNRKELVAYKFMQRYYHKGAFFRDD